MKYLMLSAVLLITTNLFAQVSYNNVTHSGTGCPQGTVSTAVSPDGSSLSVLFDEFRAEVPENGLAKSTKNCSLSFTASIPAGMKADALEISLQARGATILDKGVEATFAAILVGYSGLARSRGNPTVVSTKKWRGLVATDDSWTQTPKTSVPLMSACAGAAAKDIRIDVKNHVIAEISNGDLSKSGMITLDSNDVNGLLKFTLKTSPCR